MPNFMILMGPEGPEGLEELPEDLKETIFEERLQGKNTTDQIMSRINSMHFSMSIRARMNMHRDLNVYYICVDSDVTKDEFFNICSESPESMHELIKEKGKVLA